MGYGVAFYSGSVDEILHVLQNPTESNVSDEVITAWKEMADDLLDDDERKNLRQKLSACAAALLSPGVEDEPEVLEKLLVLALIRHHGVFIGSTDHSSRGGDAFRTLVAKCGESVYGLPKEDQPGNLLDLLTLRGFGEGPVSFDYPCWGYLRKKELEDIMRRRNDKEAQTIIDQEDDDTEWFQGIEDAFKAGLTQGKDVLCIYT